MKTVTHHNASSICFRQSNSALRIVYPGMSIGVNFPTQPRLPNASKRTVSSPPLPSSRVSFQLVIRTVYPARRELVLTNNRMILEFAGIRISSRHLTLVGRSKVLHTFSKQQLQALRLHLNPMKTDFQSRCNFLKTAAPKTSDVFQ